MAKLPVVKPKELIRVLYKLGFFEHNRVGSHAQFKHPDGRRITVTIHGGRDIKSGTLRGVIDDLNITVEEFKELL